MFKEKPSSTAEQEVTKEDVIRLTRELSESHEVFSFFGIEEAVYAKLKADDEDYPGFTTPIDELIDRLVAHGMKVVLGDDPNNGDAWILPADSVDIASDSVLPRHLKIVDGMDPRLKKLVLYGKALVESKKG